jgi:DNA polymerase-3 subunit alpha (Gram-positive type)
LDIYRSDVKKFRIEGNTLIPPFCALPGLGEAAAQSIVDERDKGPFMSMEDMILRCDRVSRSIGEALAAAGALGDIPLSNQLNLFDDLM